MMINEETKKAFLSDQLYYEFIQLFYCIVEVRKLNPDESKISVPNHLAVAFSTHARNLWEFFYAPDKHPNKSPRINHFITNWDVTPNIPVNKYYGVLNKQLSHLDYGRSKTKEPPPVAFIIVHTGILGY